MTMNEYNEISKHLDLLEAVLTILENENELFDIHEHSNVYNEYGHKIATLPRSLLCPLLETLKTELHCKIRKLGLDY